MDPLIGFIAIGLLTLVGSVLTAIEIALASLGRVRRLALLKAHPEARRFLRTFQESPQLVVTAIGLLADFLFIAAGVLLALWTAALFPELDGTARTGLALGLAVAYLLAVGGILPRTVDALQPQLEGWMLQALRLLYWPIQPLLALIALSGWLGRGVRRLLGRRSTPAPAAEAGLSSASGRLDRREREAELKRLLEAAVEAGLLDEEERRMVWRILTYEERVARQVMVPRPEVVAIPVDTPLGEVREIIAREGHSRYPVYEGTRDNVIGILHAKDLIRYGHEERHRLEEIRRRLHEELPQQLREAERRARARGLDPQADPEHRKLLEERERLEREARRLRERLRRVTLRDLIRPPFFTPPIKPLGDLLREFQRAKQHMAIVVDEFGSMVGIVTLEDVLEEIVGEISDEYDQPEQPIQRLSPREFLVEGDTEIQLLNEELGLNLPTDGAVTIGGLITQRLEEIPKPGRSIAVDGVTLIVESASAREVLKVRLKLPEPVPSSPA